MELIPNYRKYCGTEVDVWSCGVILYLLLTGSFPFEEQFVHLLFEKIAEAKYKMPEDISKEAQDLIQRMLCKDPISRISLQKIKSHPWLRDSEMLYFEPCFIQSKKVSEDVFLKLKEMNFDFKDLSKSEIQESIKAKKDYSFVVAYNLILDQQNKQRESRKMLSTFDKYSEDLKYSYMKG